MRTSIIVASLLSFASLTFAAPTATSFPFSGGVNIAGFEFGQDNNGVDTGSPVSPLDNSLFKHFARQGANIFRVPIALAKLYPRDLGNMDGSLMGKYKDSIVAGLNTGARVIVDVHNYARYQGKIFGQDSALTNQDFAKIWGNLARIFSGNTITNGNNVVFGIMNEPHDLKMDQWAATVQAAVNAIRAAGATENYILIPGDKYSALGDFSDISAPFLKDIVDPAHPDTKDYLIYDVHTYFDSDGSGTSETCVSDKVSMVNDLVTYLKANNRKAFLSELGGGSNSGCVDAIHKTLAAVKNAYPSFLGFTGWAAGSWGSDYKLSLTPNQDTSDKLLWKQGMLPVLRSK